jgi:hypothetical protein
MKKVLALFIGFTALSACSTWVGLTIEGEGVRLATANAISNCSRLGRTRSHTLGRVVGVERGADRLQEELLTLARNDAGAMGGNVIVPESLIDDGEQVFGIYSCP